jgi:hypothetical protein
MDVYRPVFVVAASTNYGAWIRQFWRAKSGQHDPLRLLLKPNDRRGEVEGWGIWPHWTVLDALTVSDPGAFAGIVKAVCRLCPPPILRPDRLAIYGATSLVVQCSSPPLTRIAHALMTATRHLIARAPLADEEFQKAEWWIRIIGKEVKANCRALFEARKEYLRAGAPPIPRSRHFRLGFLVRLWKDWKRAKKDPDRRHRHWQYFLAYGEPYWYAGAGSLHTTIASGLKVKGHPHRERILRRFTRTVWPLVEDRLKAYRPQYLAIMGEAPRHDVTVRFFDWLTETFVKDERPGFKVVDRARFSRPE